jgi:MFS family permease
MLYTGKFLLMAAANFFSIGSFATFYMFPLFILNHGGSQMDVGIVMGAFSLSSVLCRPWISRMIDSCGRKRSYTLGTLLMSLCPLAYLAFTGDLDAFYPVLLLVRVVHGVGLAICTTAAFTYVADIIPARRLNEGIGIFGVSGLIGLAIGPLVAEVVLERSGFPVFFLFAAGLGGLGLICHLPVPESYRPFTRESTPSFVTVLTQRKMVVVALLAFLFGFGTAATGSFVAPFARQQGLGFISLYYVAYSVAAVATRFGGARIGDRIGEQRVLPYALTLTGMGLVTMVLLGSNVLLATAGLLSGCGHGFLYPALLALAVRNETAAIRGKITGIFTGSIDAGVFVGSIVLGAVGDWVGFRALFLTAGMALMLGLGMFLTQGSVNRKPPLVS